LINSILTDLSQTFQKGKEQGFCGGLNHRKLERVDHKLPAPRRESLIYYALSVVVNESHTGTGVYLSTNIHEASPLGNDSPSLALPAAAGAYLPVLKTARR
jgi:hypothetical protein